MTEEPGSSPKESKDQDQRPSKREGSSPKTPRNIMSWMVLLGLAMLLVGVLQTRLEPSKELSITEFEKLVASNGIQRLDIEDDGTLRGVRHPREGDPANMPLAFYVAYPIKVIDREFVNWLTTSLPDAQIKRTKPNQFLLILFSMLPYILILVIVWFFIFRQIRSASGPGGMLGNFGRSRHRVTSKEHTNVTFSDVAGIEEAREEVQEIIEFLKCPKKFQRLGGRIPRGILLVGEPGCGKTLLAKAIAGEADVPFFSISGSDFVEMFVGVGASRVRDLFKQAKEDSPCIIFLDEIDAVGRRRGASFGGGGHDEREQTLNAILVEMDGFESSSQVIVIAATNRADVLDPALVRPGRFDRQVYVSLPDLKGRHEILKVHARKVKLGPNVDLRRSARGTPMFSGAELAALVNEAALLATLSNKQYVEQEDLEEARDKIRWGRAKKSAVVDERDRKITAYHEAGHALIQALEKDADPLHKVSIIPRGPAGGATFSLPERDRMVYGKRFLLATMRVMFGGRIGEDVFFGDISSGASSDIKQATELARRMIYEWGMGEKAGFIYYGEEESHAGMFDIGARQYSDKTAELLDHEVRSLVDECYAQAKKIILENRKNVEAIAETLLKLETISGDEVNALIRGETIERPGVSDLLDDAMPTDSVGVARPIPAEPQADPQLGGGDAMPQPS